ncbi:MAG: hypothetical protein L0Y58_22410 [Verrucomicrobia subdivision 3 bacterium]|nr:hypothetical protein [Limisphaerales bacterium]
MLDLELLQPGQLRQVYEWDNVSALEDFEPYAARLSCGNWLHYAINRDGQFVGCLSLELIGADEAGFHLSMQPRSVRLADLRHALISTGAVLFQGGIRKIIAEICPENRSARLLAALCGMIPAGQIGAYRRFELTAAEFAAKAIRL